MTSHTDAFVFYHSNQETLAGEQASKTHDLKGKPRRPQSFQPIYRQPVNSKSILHLQPEGEHTLADACHGFQGPDGGAGGRVQRGLPPLRQGRGRHHHHLGQQRRIAPIPSYCWLHFWLPNWFFKNSGTGSFNISMCYFMGSSCRSRCEF